MSPAGPTKMNKDLNSSSAFKSKCPAVGAELKNEDNFIPTNGYLKTKAQKITSVSEDIDILEPLCIASKM